MTTEMSLTSSRAVTVFLHLPIRGTNDEVVGEFMSSLGIEYKFYSNANHSYRSNFSRNCSLTADDDLTNCCTHWWIQLPPPQWPNMFPISCSFLEILAKSYVGILDPSLVYIWTRFGESDTSHILNFFL